MARTRSRRALGQTHLPAVPPWEGQIMLFRDIHLRVGDTVRVRVEWDGGLLRVELDVLTEAAGPETAEGADDPEGG